MIIQLSAGNHDILERSDYGRLKLRVPSGWTVAEIERNLPFDATCTPEHIWIRESDLRAIAEVDATSPDPIADMVGKARKYGFYDDATGTIRVHIEYY
jgi:hypothetical protein